jgi:hypothetical protein
VPATSTLAAPASSGSTGSDGLVVVLLVALIVAFAGALRFATVRNRR